MGIRAKLFAAFFAIACFGSIPLRAENPVKEKQDRFSLAVECIKRFEGWHGEKRHWPYVGYGHKVLPGERLTNDITKEQGDSILRADLRKLCRMFSYLGRDSLIAAVLSYNVGAYRLKGFGKMPKSAQEFVQTYFAKENVQDVELNRDDKSEKYTVSFANGNQVVFDNSGDWTEINMKVGPVPANVVPANIKAHVSIN